MTKPQPYNTGYVITDDDRVLLREALRTTIYEMKRGDYPFGNYLEGQKRANQMEQLLKNI